MRRWIKRLAIALSVVVLLVVAAGAIWYRQASRVPDWYAAARDLKADADSAENQMALVQNWAAKWRSAKPAERPEDQRRYALTLNAGEINALLSKWGKSAGIDDNIDDHAKDIRVRIADGKITIAGYLKQYDKVMSVILEPVEGADRYAQMRVHALEIGNVAVPLVAFDDPRTKLDSFVGRLAQRSADDIKINDRNEASGQTVTLYYAFFASQLFAGQNADAYAFVNYMGSGGKPLATRVSDVKIDDDTLTVTLESLTPEQRDKLVETLKSLGKEPE